MQQHQLQAMRAASAALKAARLLSFLHRSKTGEVATESDQARLQWLMKQLIMSRRGAAFHAAKGAIANDAYAFSSSFSEELRQYREWHNFSRQDTPVLHAAWVDRWLEPLYQLQQGTPLSQLSADYQTLVCDDIVSVLRRLSEASEIQPFSSL